jgi:quercetin dioxygenase-like cupin family protein
MAFSIVRDTGGGREGLEKDAMEKGRTRPYALKAGEGWTYNYGIDFTVKSGELAGGPRLAFVEYTTRTGEEPPDHTHATEDEIFYVLEGDVAFRCGADTFEVAGGGFVFLPRGIEHGYQIRSQRDVRLLVITSPADGVAGGWGGFVADFEKQGELRSSPACSGR